MNKLATTLIASSLALGSIGFVSAGHHEGKAGGHHSMKCDHKGKSMDDRIARMTEKLGLTEDQAKQIKSIHEKYADQKKDLRARKMENRQQLRQTMKAETMDNDKIQQLATTAGNLKTEKIILKSKIKSEVSGVLTPEQRQKRMEMHKKYHDKKSY
jgi:protein CpxP